MLKNLMIIITISLLLFSSITYLGSSISSSAVSVITLTILPPINIDVPPDIQLWDLKPSEPGIYTKQGVISVPADTGWKISVEDPDNATSGYMTEWTGTAFTGKKLHKPLIISAAEDVSLPEGGIVMTSKNPGDRNVVVTLSQEVSEEDLPLNDGHSYRISLDYRCDPVVA